MNTQKPLFKRATMITIINEDNNPLYKQAITSTCNTHDHSKVTRSTHFINVDMGYMASLGFYVSFI